MMNNSECSPKQLLSRFYSLQEERVQTYQLFEEGFQAYLAGAPSYNFPLYRQLVHEITQTFNKISHEILGIKTELQDRCSLLALSNLLGKIQEKEQQKLEMTAKLQLAQQKQKDDPADESSADEVPDLKNSIKTVVENIVEIMEELKYESEDLYDTDGDVDQDDSTLMADR